MSWVGSKDDISSASRNTEVFFDCRTIKIGSYMYIPKEKVHLSVKGLRIVAPLIKNESKDVAIQIQLRDITKVLVHFNKELSVIFLYTLSKCGVYIRKVLEMEEGSGLFYNPMATEVSYKRITLLPEVVTDEIKTVLITLLQKTTDVLTMREAYGILVRTCPKENINISKLITSPVSDETESDGVQRNDSIIKMKRIKIEDAVTEVKKFKENER